MITVDDKYLKHTATLCKEVKDTSFEITGLFDNVLASKKILEVGCGTGQDALRMAKTLPNSNVFAIDYDQNMIDHLDSNITIRNQQNLSFAQKSVYELEEVSSYDVIRSERVFQHLEDMPNAFERLTKALKKDGGLLTVDTNWGTLEASSFTEQENQKIQNIFTGQLINDLTPEYLEQLYIQHNFSEIKKEIITVGLSYEDYMRTLQFYEIVLDKFSEDQKNELLIKAELYKNTENFALIDMMIFYGKHS